MRNKLRELKIKRHNRGQWFIISWAALLFVVLLTYFTDLKIERLEKFFFTIYIANVMFATTSLVHINIKIYNYIYKNLFMEV